MANCNHSWPLFVVGVFTVVLLLIFLFPPHSNHSSSGGIKPIVNPQSGIITLYSGALPNQAEPTSAIEPLVERAQHGEVAAFEQLYHRHVGRVNMLCYRLSGDKNLAEDLTQEAFIKAWERLPQFRGESTFGTWLHRLAVNVALGERRQSERRQARVIALDDLSTLPDPAHTPQLETALDLEQAIAGLPPGARAVFVLHDVEGYRHEEIAQMTGIAIGTSKSQLSRARTLLKEALQQDDLPRNEQPTGRIHRW
ncbi:MAG: RNA polymerase sigma factor [Armatimonadetes bacterium]|nr:RNA polymerase sigma factor [Armatimonadota bacterium]